MEKNQINSMIIEVLESEEQKLKIKLNKSEEIIKDEGMRAAV